jgi:hypothetical protein
MALSTVFSIRRPWFRVEPVSMIDGMPNFRKLEPRPDDIHSQVRFMVVALVAKP